MRPDDFIVAVILLLPVLLLSVVWWLWMRRPLQGRAWRQTATLISATAATASSALLLGLLGCFFASIVPPVGHPILFSTLALLGFVLCIASIPAAVLGLGAFRWLIIPVALLHGYCWIVVARMATTSFFPASLRG